MASGAFGAAATPNGWSQRMMPRFAVNCTGHETHSSRTEYVFRVRHSGGCEWTVQRRYLDLLDLHERLSAVFGAGELPPFPPRTSTTVVGVLFGQKASCRPEIVAERELAFQKYFDALCIRADVVGTACFQHALGVVPPEPVSHLRVRGWLPPSVVGHGLTALLDIRPAEQAEDIRAVSESYTIKASCVQDPAGDDEELRLVASMRQPASGLASMACVEGLAPGAQVEFEVCATNAAGQSFPVSIRSVAPTVGGSESGRLDVPQRVLSHTSASSVLEPPQCSDPDASSPDSGGGKASNSREDAASVVDAEVRLQLERQELERWWADRQSEAERADKEREKLMAEFCSQRQQFEQEREKLLSAAASPAASPRGSTVDVPPSLAEDDKDQQDKGVLPCDDDFKKQQEELDRQWASLRLAQEEHKREEERAAEEREGWLLAARLQQADMEQQLGASSNQDASELLEMKRAQEELSAANVAKEAGLKQSQDALQREADDLARKEELLSHERLELNRSRAHLAVVQAHVVSMLDRAQTGGQLVSHRMDESFAPEQSFVMTDVGQPSQEAAVDADPGNSDAGVWNMDWAGAFQTQDSANTRIPQPPCSKASVPA